MTTRHLFSLKTDQRGQAMTELNIVTAFVLLPLFLLIPIMGKYIDIKHTTVQTARYMAWERTAYFPSANEIASDATNAISLPQKNVGTLQKEALHRFFGKNDANAKITSTSTPTLSDSTLNAFWRSHNKNAPPLISLASLNDSNSFSDIPIKKESAWINTVDSIVNTIQTPLRYFQQAANFVARQANRISILGGSKIFNEAKLNAITWSIPFLPEKEFPTKNYYTSAVNYKLNPISSRNQGFGQEAQNALLDPFDKIQTSMSAQSALLTDTWSAQDDEMFKKRTKQRVPTNWLQPFFEPMQSAMSYAIRTPPITIGKIVKTPRVCTPKVVVLGKTIIPELCNSAKTGTEVTIKLRDFAFAPELANSKFKPGDVSTQVVAGNQEEPDCRLGECSFKDKAARTSSVQNNAVLNVIRSVVPGVP